VSRRQQKRRSLLSALIHSCYGPESLQGMKFVTLIMIEQAHPGVCIAFHGELKSWDGLKSHEDSAPQGPRLLRRPSSSHSAICSWPWSLNATSTRGVSLLPFHPRHTSSRWDHFRPLSPWRLSSAVAHWRAKCCSCGEIDSLHQC